MPGQIKPGARCPECGDELLAIMDETSGVIGEPESARVVREYFHEKGSPKARRRRPCKRVFTGAAAYEVARRERRRLEDWRFTRNERDRRD